MRTLTIALLAALTLCAAFAILQASGALATNFFSRVVLGRASPCRPQPGSLAYYCPATHTYHLNHKAIAADVACDFCYFRNPTTPTGRQKQNVFARMDPDGKNLRAWIRSQPDPVKAYTLFIDLHEQGHAELHRHRKHTKGLMHEDTIRMEIEANLYAYKKLSIPTSKSIKR